MIVHLVCRALPPSRSRIKPGKKSKSKENALHHASFAGHLPIVKYFVFKSWMTVASLLPSQMPKTIGGPVPVGIAANTLATLAKGICICSSGVSEPLGNNACGCAPPTRYPRYRLRFGIKAVSSDAKHQGPPKGILFQRDSILSSSCNKRHKGYSTMV